MPATKKKATTKGPAALDVLDELYVGKGKKVARPHPLLGLLLGPTGNLRAPTLRKAGR